MKIGIVGYTGFIGTRLAAELLVDRRGDQFIKLGRIELEQGFLPGYVIPDVVVNLIRPHTLKDAIQTSWTIRKWDLPVLQVSSNVVYDYPPSRYALYKRVQEWILGRDIILRLPHVTGSYEHPCVYDVFERNAREGRPLVVTNPQKLYDFIPVRTVVSMLREMCRWTIEQQGWRSVYQARSFWGLTPLMVWADMLSGKGVDIPVGAVVNWSNRWDNKIANWSMTRGYKKTREYYWYSH